jgi:hypothetical protein
MNKATRHLLTRARKLRQNLSAFADLISAPASGSVTLPANGRFAFVAVGAKVAGTPIADLVGPSNRSIASPAMADGEALVLDNAERATVVTVHAGFDLYVTDKLNTMFKICGGV